MNDAAARAVILRAWTRTGGPSSPAALQTVQAIARFESGYGAPADPKWGGSHNWGATQAPHVAPCGPGEFEYTDTNADGTPYQACFVKYATDEDGAAALIRELVRRPAVRAALDSGNATRIAGAMHDTHYFVAAPAGYAAGIARVAASISKALAEPLYLTPNGASSPLPAAGAATIAVLLLAGYLIWREAQARQPPRRRGRKPRNTHRRSRR
jgi:hypothetical protein